MGTSVTGHTQPPVIDLRKVTKTYGVGETLVKAVRGIDLTVHTGDYVAVMGASGSGKSTLMNVLGCLDTPTTGHYFLDGLDVADMDEHALALVRNRRIGFIFQAFNLIPRTTALANVEIPMAYARVPRAERRERAQAALELVGMADRAHHRPNELSGGQQQPVAIRQRLQQAARAVGRGAHRVQVQSDCGNCHGGCPLSKSFQTIY